MVTDKFLESKFTWGDSVFVSKSAPSCYYPEKIGSICGFRLIQTTEIVDAGVNTFLYLVEFSSGESVEIPEKFLIKI